MYWIIGFIQQDIVRLVEILNSWLLGDNFAWHDFLIWEPERWGQLRIQQKDRLLEWNKKDDLSLFSQWKEIKY